MMLFGRSFSLRPVSFVAAVAPRASRGTEAGFAGAEL